MIIPTIHLNGTPKKMLLEQWEEAYNALLNAQRRLAEAAPHGRDYYPQDFHGALVGEALYIAQDEHRARMLKIESVMDDLVALCEAIS